MAFELSPDISEGELSFQYTIIGSDHVVQMPIGYDNVDERVFSLLVAMSPPGGGAPGEFELVFCVIDFDERSNEELGRFWDGLQTRRVITESGHRALVLGAVLAAAHFLITQISPSVVHMVTHSSDLPDKALQKFNQIATLFGQNGYLYGRCDRYHGQHIWIMRKV